MSRPTHTMATVQVSALLLFTAPRMIVPTGRAAWIFMLSIVGPLAVLTPTGLALSWRTPRSCIAGAARRASAGCWPEPTPASSWSCWSWTPVALARRDAAAGRLEREQG